MGLRQKGQGAQLGGKGQKPSQPRALFGRRGAAKEIDDFDRPKLECSGTDACFRPRVRPRQPRGP